MKTALIALTIFVCTAATASACFVRPPVEIHGWIPAGPIVTHSSPTDGTPVPAPIANPSLPVEAYCVQTVEAGETFVQANPGSFEAGGDWYALEQTGATVILDKHTRTLSWEDGHGVILAAMVPGIGLTCDAPWVSTDGVYLDPSYGLR